MPDSCCRLPSVNRRLTNKRFSTSDASASRARIHTHLAAVSIEHEETLGPDLQWPADFHKHYLKGKAIGAGSFGTVYLGINIHTGQQVAIKVLPKIRGKFGKERTLPKLVQEVAVLNVLQDCANIAKLEGYFEQEDHVLLVTELCCGGDLQWVSENHGALNEPLVALIASEALKVIKACHDKGIIHGDIKPANFLLKEKRNNPVASSVGGVGGKQGGNCGGFKRGAGPGAGGAAAAWTSPWLKAVDFGCSQITQGSARIHKRTGTPMYMAPEIFQRNYSSEADMWSLGVMLYQLYSGRFPFWQESGCPVNKLEEMQAAIMSATIRYNFGPWHHMSREGKDFIRLCLEHDYGSRMRVEEALGHQWLEGVRGTQGEAEGEGEGEGEGVQQNNILPKATKAAKAQQKQYVRRR